MTPIVEKFVLHWGEMGSRWGVNRSVAQIHGLLYLMQKAHDCGANLRGTEYCPLKCLQ